MVEELYILILIINATLRHYIKYGKFTQQEKFQVFEAVNTLIFARRYGGSETFCRPLESKSGAGTPHVSSVPLIRSADETGALKGTSDGQPGS